MSYSPSILIKPKNVDDALTELKKSGANARIVAGNTTLYELSQQGALSDVEKLIDATQLGLDYIKFDSERSLIIGATTTFEELARSSVIQGCQCLYALTETAQKITPPQIRNMGTVGGSVCSGIPFYDMPTTLLALEARATLASTDGKRKVGLDEFFLDYFLTALSPGELLLELELPNEPDSGSAFMKLGRTSADFAVVNVAAKVKYDPKMNSIEKARIALGAVASTPLRSSAAEEMLCQKPLTEELLNQAAKEAVSNLEPTSSVHASSNYKKRVIPVLVKQALLSALVRSRAQISKQE